jgi:hypothetical protein
MYSLQDHRALSLLLLIMLLLAGAGARHDRYPLNMNKIFDSENDEVAPLFLPCVSNWKRRAIVALT